MKGAQSRIQRLFTPLEQRATLPPPDRLTPLRNVEGLLLRLRQLRPGERRRTGDFWSDGRTLHLVRLPWWRRSEALTTEHFPHYRVSE